MKTKYAGLDLHQSTTALHVRNDDNQTVMESIIRTNREALLGVLEGLTGEDKRLEVAFEESGLTHLAYETLESHVDRVVVCNPADPSQRGSKTDKKDAEKISRYLRIGELNEVYHGDGIDHQLRDMFVPTSKPLSASFGQRIGSKRSLEVEISIRLRFGSTTQLTRINGSKSFQPGHIKSKPDNCTTVSNCSKNRRQLSNNI